MQKYNKFLSSIREWRDKCRGMGNLEQTRGDELPQLRRKPGLGDDLQITAAKEKARFIRTGLGSH